MRERVPPQPASLSFQPASSKERVLLQNLAQFYYYDFSEMLEMYVDDDGRFGITGKSGVFDMTEFFVLRRFRRRGVGRAAAFAAFDRFGGTWEVRQRAESPNATAFWRRAIDEYTRGDYEETRWDRPQWSEIVQTFSTASGEGGLQQ